MQRLESQNLCTGLDGPLDLGAFHQEPHEAEEDIDGLIPVAGRFRAAPGFKLLTVELEPVQKIAAALHGRDCQVRPARLRRKPPKCQEVDVEGGDIQNDIVLVGSQEAMFGIAKRLAAAPPDTGPQIVQQGLVRGIAPNQCRQFPAWLTAFSG